MEKRIFENKKLQEMNENSLAEFCQKMREREKSALDLYESLSMIDKAKLQTFYKDILGENLPIWKRKDNIN